MTWSRPLDGTPLMALMSQPLMAHRVAGRLAHDVAVQTVVGARDALALHDVEGLADPAVEVVGVDRLAGGGAAGGGGLVALLRLGLGLRLGVRRGLGRRGGLGLLVRGHLLLGDGLRDRLGARDGRREGGGLGSYGVARLTRPGEDREGESGGAEGGYTGNRDLVRLGETTMTKVAGLGHGGWTSSEWRGTAHRSAAAVEPQRCATGAIVSGRKIWWQRCYIRSRVVDQGTAKAASYPLSRRSHRLYLSTKRLRK